jgi:hypothetical protein
MSEYIPIRHLSVGSKYRQVFLISDYRQTPAMNTAKGVPFARIAVQDTTGYLEGVIWNPTKDIQPGDFVDMEVVLHVYGDHAEIKTNDEHVFEVLSEEPDNLYDYIRGKSNIELGSYADELQEYATMVQDKHYNEVLGSAINDMELVHTLKKSTYGLSGPLAYPGGLLVHVVHTMRFARVATKQSRENEMPFNAGLVIAGCMFRSIGWSTTTMFRGNILRPRDAYHMIGPRRASARYVDHLMLSLESALGEPIPEGKRQALENICKPVEDIRTIEGKIVAESEQMADLLDFASDMLNTQSQYPNWTPNLDGFFVGHLS